MRALIKRTECLQRSRSRLDCRPLGGLVRFPAWLRRYWHRVCEFRIQSACGVCLVVANLAIMDDDEALWFGVEEVFPFLEQLMPDGFAGDDVMAELAPNGWAHSALVHAFHPSVEQWHEEQVAMCEPMAKLSEAMRKGKGTRGDLPFEDSEPLEPPTFEESYAEFEATLVDPAEECRDIVGRVLWEIFSDNHSVIAADGREIDLGSFRGASSTLALFDAGDSMADYREDWMDVWDQGDTIRFYMGLAFFEGRTDFGVVYEMVFRRLQKLGVDWIYRFPQLGVVRFEQPETQLDAVNYDPSEAIGRELKQREEDAECEEMQAKMDEANRASAEAAAKDEPPPIIRAYRRVYGRLPSGWPPV